MLPFTLLLEFVGILSKTLALIMRLFANMIGGHVAILLILLLILKFQSLAVGPIAVVVDLAIMALELFVAVLQAYIFSFLSALFIGWNQRTHARKETWTMDIAALAPAIMKFGAFIGRHHRRRSRGPRRRDRSRAHRLRAPRRASPARPEASGKIQTNMLLAAVLVEGVGIIALVICILAIVM